jgi:hypothetical protein
MQGQILRQALIVAVGMAAVAGAPAKGQAPSGTTEVWPDDTLATIQAAVDCGGTVYFHPGTYHWTGILSINNSVEIMGPEPTGHFSTKTGTDDRVWQVKITKRPTGIWDTRDAIILMDCLGETEKVAIRNLDTECLSSGMCMLVQGGGDSLHIANCRIKTVDDGYGLATWEARDVSVIIEDCHVEAGTAGFLKPDGTGPNTDCLSFAMSSHATIEVKNNIVVNHCDNTSTSTAVEVAWNRDPNTRVTISNNWLQSAGEGVTVWYYDSACSIGTVSHNTMVGNTHFAHYENSGSGGTIESNRFRCNGGGTASLYFKDSADVTVQSNTVTGSVLTAGIMLDGHSSGYVFVANDLANLSTGVAQILVQPECHGILFARNVVGALAPDGLAGICCGGDNNDFVRNDYTQSGIAGLTSGGQPCLILGPESEGNLVFESASFPVATGDATEQILDLPREPGCAGRSCASTNTVVGHSADVLAEDIDPGVAKRVRDALSNLQLP